jgi:hypothetical protein
MYHSSVSPRIPGFTSPVPVHEHVPVHCAPGSREATFWIVLQDGDYLIVSAYKHYQSSRTVDVLDWDAISFEERRDSAV